MLATMQPSGVFSCMTVQDADGVSVSDVAGILQQEGALRIEEIAEKLNTDFCTTRDKVHRLWGMNLVVSGPNFEFDLDSGGVRR